MRFPVMVCCTALVGMICVTAHAQDGCGQPVSTPVTCNESSPSYCNEGIVVTVPQSSEYGVSFIAGYLSCCGARYDNFYANGGCQTAQMKNPEIIEQLIRATSLRPVLIADCSGKYQPFDREAALWLSSDSYRRNRAPVADAIYLDPTKFLDLRQ
jgi:hypothetical protein